MRHPSFFKARICRNDINVNFYASCNRIYQQSYDFVENSAPFRAGTIIISLRKFLPRPKQVLANSSKEGGTCCTHERSTCSQQEDLGSNMCVCECKH